MQLLKSVEPYPIGDWGWNASKTIHLMTEAERRVYADRATYLGDPDFINVPISALTDSTYVASRMKNFDPAKATASALTVIVPLLTMEAFAPKLPAEMPVA